MMRVSHGQQDKADGTCGALSEAGVAQAKAGGMGGAVFLLGFRGQEEGCAFLPKATRRLALTSL